MKTRECASCREERDDFSRTSSYCRPCVVLRKRAETLSRYGLSLEDFNRIVEKLDRRCPICQEDPSLLKKGWAIDHCHETGAFRGIICTRCNAGIGGLGDTAQSVEKAIGYLLNFYRLNPRAAAAHIQRHPQDTEFIGMVDTNPPDRVSRSCQHCSKPLARKHSPSRQYCDRACRTEAMLSREFTCPVCGTVGRTAERRRIYCSNACYNSVKSSRTYSHPPCPICTKTFVSHTGRQIYCSPTCYEKSRPKTLSPSCLECRRVFSSRDKRKKFCSPKCAYDHMYPSRKTTLG
ncbi:endonuclease VII domain-containing protein [Catellatospora sichuanensis]|uniref:endonuclease VII domain-containing protein n=1 Tax=Catellatospora sichuanensis TaxID=1969805 RepID=UPI003CCC6706